MSAAQTGDAAALAEAAGRAAGADVETVRLLLGSVVRALVEQAHPDGIGADDLGDLVRRCVRTSSPWWPDPHVDVLAAVLAGALGVHPDAEGPDAGSAPRPSPADLVCGAAILAAELLPPGGSVEPCLDAAFAELRRAETVELP